MYYYIYLTEWVQTVPVMQYGHRTSYTTTLTSLLTSVPAVKVKATSKGPASSLRNASLSSIFWKGWVDILLSVTYESM